MTPAQYAAIVAAPTTDAVWRIAELTPQQYAGIVAAIAALNPPYTPPNHLQTAGSSLAPTYGPTDGGAVTAHTGTDSAGTVTIEAGTGFSGPVVLVHVAFTTAFAHPPACIAQAVDTTSGANLDTEVANVAVNGFDVKTNGTVAAADFVVIAWIACGAPN